MGPLSSPLNISFVREFNKARDCLTRELNNIIPQFNSEGNGAVSVL